MLTAITNVMNDHRMMNTVINYLGAFTMLVSLVPLCLCGLCVFYPARRKR